MVLSFQCTLTPMRAWTKMMSSSKNILVYACYVTKVNVSPRESTSVARLRCRSRDRTRLHPYVTMGSSIYPQARHNVSTSVSVTDITCSAMKESLGALTVLDTTYLASTEPRPTYHVLYLSDRYPLPRSHLIIPMLLRMVPANKCWTRH